MKLKFVILAVMVSIALSFAQSSLMRFPKEMAPQRGNVALVPMVVESQVDSSYVIGPGDFFDLFLESSYFSVQVNADGTIAIEECGVIEVGGLTLAEAKKAILEKVSSKYREQYSSVQLSKLKSFTVSVMGAVAHVGQIPVDAQTKLTTLINKALFMSIADPERIVIIRGKDSILVDYNAIVQYGNFDADPVLMQGDKVFVPFLKADSMVTLVLPDKRVSLAFIRERTIAEYYLLAMGNSIESAGLESIKVVDIDGKERTISVAEANKETIPNGSEFYCDKKKKSGTADDPEKKYVYVGGAVAAMGRVPYNPGYKAIDYIAASGVTPMTGTWDQVSVVRGNRQTFKVNATEDEILPGDYIEIPPSRYEKFKDVTMFLASLLGVLSSVFIVYMTYK